MADSAAMTMTRRALLLGAAGGLGLSLAACRDHKKGEAGTTLNAADVGALSSAHGDELRILASYDALSHNIAGADHFAIETARDEHRAHVAALSARLPRPTVTPTPDGAGLLAGAALHEEIQRSTARLSSAAVGVRDGQVAAVMASVAAAHAAEPPVRYWAASWYGGKP
jgi:hypothetical protein